MFSPLEQFDFTLLGHMGLYDPSREAAVHMYTDYGVSKYILPLALFRMY